MSRSDSPPPAGPRRCDAPAGPCCARGERDPTCLPALVGVGPAAGRGSGPDCPSRTAILAEDVRVLQITGISP